jgi:DNA polymerase delta subunit 2
MFGKAAAFGSFHCESNPAWLRVRCGDEPESLVTREGETSLSSRPAVTRSILVTSGQPILDMYKYLPTPPSSLVSIAASTLRWRHIAPTAPDTLWCHPYRDRDPFVLRETPDIYFLGGMPQFGTELVSSEDGTVRKERCCRIVLVPSFSQTGILVLVNLRTLDVHRVDFGVEGLNAGGGEHQPSGEDRDSMTEG